MNKKQKQLLADLEIGTENEIIVNPFSGQEVELDPRGVALYDFIRGANMLGQNDDADIAKELFAELYPDYYMILID